MRERKRRKFWFYIIFIIILYAAAFFAVNNLNISGLFVVETLEKVNFNDLGSTYNLNQFEEFKLDIDYLQGYSFSDNTDLFDIDENTGLISFTPSSKDKYPVVIIVTNGLQYNTKVILFNVT